MKSTELPTNRVLMSAISVALAMAASAGPAHGQDTAAQAMPAKGGAGQLEEVVVTAQRRTEDIIGRAVQHLGGQAGNTSKTCGSSTRPN